MCFSGGWFVSAFLQVPPQDSSPSQTRCQLLHDASRRVPRHNQIFRRFDILFGICKASGNSRELSDRIFEQFTRSDQAPSKRWWFASVLVVFFFFVWENQSYKSVVWTLRNTEHPPCFIADLEVMGGRDLCAEPGWLSHPVFSLYAKPKLLELRIYPTDTCWSSHLNVKGKNKQEFLSCTSSQRGSLFYVAVAGNHPFCDQNYLYNVDEMSAPLNMLPGSDVQDTSVLVCVREK